MALEQVVLSGAEFLKRGWTTGYAVTDRSVAIVCVDDGVMVWSSWDEGEGDVTERCNPDVPLYDAGGALLRAPGPRAVVAAAPDLLVEAEAAIKAATTVAGLRAAVLKAVDALDGLPG